MKGGLLNGSKKDGISALFEAGPHAKLFLSQFCQKESQLYIPHRVVIYSRTGSLDNTTNTSISLSLQSFEGLLAITGSVTTVCLLIFLLVYFHKNKDFLQTNGNSNTTAWSRIWEMWRHFDGKDLSSYPFSRTRGNQVDHQFGDIPNTNASYMIDSPPSLARNSDLSGIVSSWSEEGGRRKGCK
ncbi:hypothetical protein LguiA_028900 [Lonicera macranthoides]